MQEQEQMKKLDNLALKIIREPNLAFIGSFLFNTEITIDNTIETACTNGVYLKINPVFFFEYLTKEERFFTIIHELWHIAKLHAMRRESRDPFLWNMACDYHINALILEDNRNWSVQPKLPKGALYNKCYKDKSEEEIYEELVKNHITPPANFIADIKDATKEEQSQAISKVGQAIQSAKMAGTEVGKDFITFFNEFTKSKISWRKLLHKFCTEALDKSDFTWKKPNRRYKDLYLPSLDYGEGALTHLIYFLDVSGSIDDKTIQIFNSEVKAIKEQLHPEKLTLIQFDTHILRTDVFTKDKPFSNISIVNGGGTSYEDVRDLILKEKPTAAIILTDLYCSPMQPVKVPVLWVTLERDKKYRETPITGKVIEIKD